MLQDIYVSRSTGQIVQKISQCRILPEETEAVCYQQMSGEYPVYVMERGLFEQTYRRRGDLVQTSEPQTETDDSLSDLIRFLDADSYREKMKILEGMKENLDEHMLNNLAVSLDLSIEDNVDGYSFIMSELKIRSRFEGKRGERL